MSIPSRCRTVVFDPKTKSFSVQDIPASWPKAGEAIVQIETAALTPCDLDFVTNASTEDPPRILGHEAVGVILALGDPPPQEFSGGELAVGDRVIWSPYVSCGECFYCRRRLPQQCESLLEYGRHALREVIVDPPRLTGAMSELVHLWPKTALFKIPKSLPAPVAASLPHAGAQAAAAIDVLLAPVNTAIVVGASLEAQLAAAMLNKRGATVEVLDSTCAIHEADSLSLDSPKHRRNVDALLDFSGESCVYDFALRELHPGGSASFTKAATEPPKPEPQRAQINSLALIQKSIRVTGIHRYKPEHLTSAVDFIIHHAVDRSLRDAISKPRPFLEANEVIAEAMKTGPVRIVFEPDMD